MNERYWGASKSLGDYSTIGSQGQKVSVKLNALLRHAAALNPRFRPPGGRAWLTHRGTDDDLVRLGGESIRPTQRDAAIVSVGFLP